MQRIGSDPFCAFVFNNDAMLNFDGYIDATATDLARLASYLINWVATPFFGSNLLGLLRNLSKLIRVILLATSQH